MASSIYWTPNYTLLEQPPQGWQGGLAYLLDPNHLAAGCIAYWHVGIFGLEKQFLTTDAEAVFNGNTSTTEKLAAMRGAHPSSQLKVMMEWPSALQERRVLIADLGTGIDIKIGPTSHMRASLLLPDPTGIAVPTAMAALSDESTATIVTAKAVAVGEQGDAWNGRYTQTLLVGAGGPATLHEIPRFARTLSVYQASATLADPPTVLTTAVTASFIFDQAVAGGLAPVGSPGVYGGGLSAISEQEIPIPQNAKLVALSATTERLVTLVYGLSL